MKKRNLFSYLKPTTLCSLLVLSGSAWAASPYDTAFGLQWNFMIGTAGQDATQLFTDVTSDGTVFVMNYTTNNSTWGVGTTNSINSGMGAITPLGQVLYGTTLSSLPGMTSPGQNYPAGLSAAGNTAYFGVHGASSQYWSGQDPTDSNRMMTFSLNSSSLSSITNQRRLTKFKDGIGTLRTDGFGPILPGGGLTQPAQNRGLDSVVRASTLDMIIVGNSLSDFAFAGDWGGVFFGCFVGRYNLGTNTLTGPEKQPVVRDDDVANTIVRGDFGRAGVDQTTGRYYASGAPNSAGATFDPDGTGPLAPIAIDASASTNALFVAYDPATPPTADTIAYALVWDSPTAGTTSERINAIAPTNDGTNSVFLCGLTTGDMPGFIGTNANPNVSSDSYIELRDATGALVWSEQFAISSASDGIQSANVDSNGDLYVSGYTTEPVSTRRDSWVRKYKKTGPGTYTVAWTSIVVNPLDPTNTLINDQLYEHACVSDGEKIYLAVQTAGQWSNTTGHTFAGTNDVLLHKMSPGDFNADGNVDFADVQIAGTATKPGLTGVDTYDFNRDGDSTLADTTYMITNIMDRLVSDIAQDTRATDVDNADIGKAIGASGVGTLYLDGDIDFDGDVQNDDITTVAAAFTGAKAPSGYGASLTAGATLRYRASDGQVWLHAGEAAGDIITSFQLENAAGTFVPANFTGPSGGGYGGVLKESTSSVLADTDLTLAGASGTGGVISLGTIFPTGMSEAALGTYLKTAVYTGQAGSGQMKFTLVEGDLVLTPPFETWAATFPTLTKPSSNIDFDGGGLVTGIEWVVGGDPTNPADDAGNTPTFDNSDPDDFKFVFKRRDEAAADSNTIISVQYGTDLSTWRNTIDHGVIDSVTTDDSVDLGGGFHEVTVSIPKTLAPDGKLFARLGVSGLPFSLLDEDFEGGNAGFTVSTASGSNWEFGAPNTSDLGGGSVTSGNSGTNCWGTNLNGAYAASTDTKLRSPVIDLTGVATATLSFAQAIDIKSSHTLVVNVIEEATDTVVQSAIHTSTPDTNATSAAWEPVTVATPITGGQKVRIEWHFVGDGDGFYLGAYIDDVLVTSP
jgi:hypothetical protein